MVHHPLPIPKEEKYPPPLKNHWYDHLTRPHQKHRVVYTPDSEKNAKFMRETTWTMPPSIRSVWTVDKLQANRMVRKLEWEKIQNSPDPERALKRYNDFNGPWVKPPKEYLELFKLERTFNEYHNKEPLTQWHEQPQQWSTWMKEFDWLQYEKGSLQPTYFGFSRFRKE